MQELLKHNQWATETDAYAMQIFLGRNQILSPKSHLVGPAPRRGCYPYWPDSPAS